MTKIIFIILTLFCISCSSNKKKFDKQIPSLEFCISKQICVLGEAYFSKELNSGIFLNLNDKIESSFRNASFEQKKDFINSIAENKIEHEFIDSKFADIFKQALLTYDQIYDKNLEVLTEKKFDLAEFCKNNLIKKEGRFLFEKVFTFYRTTLAKDTKFLVYLYPSTQGNFPMTNLFGKKIFLRFAYGNTENNICLILREVCRCLYEAQGQVFHEQFKTYMLKNSSPYGVPAYYMFDDILSDAIALRWLFRKLKSRENTFEPYNADKKLLAVSKYIEPEVEKYLEEGKVIDTAFAEKVIEAVKLQHKDSIKNAKFMLENINLKTGAGLNYKRYETILKQSFPLSQVFELKNRDNFPLVFIGDTLGDPAILKIHSKIPNFKYDFIFTAIDKDSKTYIIVKSTSEEKIKKAFDILKSIQYFEDGFVARL